ncbi:hypothetical protein A1O3_07210 [Capronia epimyces CBS 606.96]|uniref:DNA (cytosine-5-)-methyltransferase n=1 Tax=Capronia epimyces CBS 606.96 TaxID=1182542 RepID=W9XK96_9EURO|nr:uncharacterized protein A1O3_07210 [Capronia epimyces CBS 606.96]EXJ80922.1 hypothetical protein A1O3_07210 [Capronia epimyces CBS 606.96]
MGAQSSVPVSQPGAGRNGQQTRIKRPATINHQVKREELIGNRQETRNRRPTTNIPQNLPIVLIEDDDDDVVMQEIRNRRPTANTPAVLIEDEEEDVDVVMHEDEDDDVVMQDDEVEFEEISPHAHRRATQPGPGQPDLTPGRDVELQDGSFLRIEATGYDNFHEPYIQGRRLLSHTAPEILMPETEGELVWEMYFNHDMEESPKKVGYHPRDVVRNCKILFTNHMHRDLNVSHIICNNDDRRPVYFCRWKYSLPPPDLRRKPDDPYRHRVGKIERLRSNEADESFGRTKHVGKEVVLGIPDPEIRKRWRGPESDQDLLGSSKTHAVNDNGGFDIVRKYTFGDSFCGAGGATCGAVQAGLVPKWAFDLDEAAIRTYRLNFGKGVEGHQVQARHEHVSDFLAAARRSIDSFLVDIAHLSPPCQPFSPANTTPNEMLNEINTAALTSVYDILNVSKPRIATLEEAAGMEHPRHHNWLRKLVTMFIDNGYSVRWKIVDMKSFGVPQTRDRLIVIASGPGETLPPFVSPTHGPEPGLKPWPSISSAIDNIDRGALHHRQRRHFNPPKAAINATGLAGTVTTGGGSEKVYHPSGTRPYTVRELACLQTFPHEFRFAGKDTDKVRQIGNAVPPRFQTTLLLHLRAFVEENDRSEMASGV